MRSRLGRRAHNCTVGRSGITPAYDRWSGAHLMQGALCRRLTSGLSFRRSSEMRVSRVFFSGPYQCCVGHAMAGWRGACGY